MVLEIHAFLKSLQYSKQGYFQKGQRKNNLNLNCYLKIKLHATKKYIFFVYGFIRINTNSDIFIKNPCKKCME